MSTIFMMIGKYPFNDMFNPQCVANNSTENHQPGSEECINYEGNGQFIFRFHKQI